MVHGCLPLLLRFRIFPWLPAGISRIAVTGGDRLAHSFHRFSQGEIRLILAVRHCEVDDPLCGLHLLSRELPRQASRLGLSISRPPHTHFLFDRGMPLWGGRPLGWVLSRLGGVSVRRGRQPDWTALREARRLVLEGDLPFAVAPEGATNGHGEHIGPLEPGLAQLALWGMQDIQASGRARTVQILPIGIRYVYLQAQWWRLEAIMGELESSIGIGTPSGWNAGSAAGEVERWLGRLLRILEALVDRLEDGHLGLTQAARAEREETRSPSPDGVGAGGGLGRLDRRIRALVDGSLREAETRLGLISRGTPERRCRRVEEGIWRWVYREDLPARGDLSRLDRGLADRAALQASMAEVPMRLAESFVAVSATYLSERPSYERLMEVSLLIHDALARLRGDRLPRRPRIGARQARLTVGEPIDVGAMERLALGSEETGQGRRFKRRMISLINDAIRQSFEADLPAPGHAS